MSRPWMPLYWGDFYNDTRHMTTLQVGAYMLLIGEYWSKGGWAEQQKISKNFDKYLQKISGLSDHLWIKNRSVIAARFGRGWSHKRIDSELIKCEIIRTKRAMAGQRGGNVTRNKWLGNENATKGIWASKRPSISQPHSKKVASEKETVVSTELLERIGKWKEK